MSAQVLWVVGAGGHAKVVIATARVSGWSQIRVVDDDPDHRGKAVLGLRVEGPAEPVLADRDALVVIAIGDNATRARLAAVAQCQLATLVHPRASVDSSARLGAGTVVFAGAVIQPETVLGDNVIVNTSASIDHDSRLGHAVHIAPGAHLCGNVTVGDHTLVGVGASVRPGVTIGSRVTIGAGAAVVRDLEDGVTAFGVPARIH